VHYSRLVVFALSNINFQFFCTWNLCKTILNAIYHYYTMAIFFHYTDWIILDEHFSLLCNCLPDDYQSTLIKLKSLPQLSNDDHQQLDSMISSSHQLVNEKIVTFLIVKLCYNGSTNGLVELCDVMDNLMVSKQLASCVQQVRCGKNNVCNFKVI